MIARAVFNPFGEELFFAKKGQRVYLNKKKVGAQKSLNKATVATDNFYLGDETFLIKTSRLSSTSKACSKTFV